jgi:hypothetical protein
MSCGHIVKVGAARAIAGALRLLGHSTACRLVSPLFLNLKDRGRRPGGGGERELNQILKQELAYVTSSNPKAITLQEGDEHTNK